MNWSEIGMQAFGASIVLLTCYVLFWRPLRWVYRWCREMFKQR